MIGILVMVYYLQVLWVRQLMGHSLPSHDWTSGNVLLAIIDLHRRAGCLNAKTGISSGNIMSLKTKEQLRRMRVKLDRAKREYRRAYPLIDDGQRRNKLRRILRKLRQVADLLQDTR